MTITTFAGAHTLYSLTHLDTPRGVQSRTLTGLPEWTASLDPAFAWGRRLCLPARTDDSRTGGSPSRR
jgi:hypothetical protein